MNSGKFLYVCTLAYKVRTGTTNRGDSEGPGSAADMAEMFLGR